MRGRKAASRGQKEVGGSGDCKPKDQDEGIAACCTRVLGPDGRELNTLKWRDFTDAEFEGRRQMREYARFFRDYLVGCERSFVNDTGVQVGVRQTRQMSGVSKLMNTDVVEGTKSSQGIARSRRQDNCRSSSG